MFHASSAACTFWGAVSSVNGGNGGFAAAMGDSSPSPPENGPFSVSGPVFTTTAVTGDPAATRHARAAATLLRAAGMLLRAAGTASRPR